MSQVFEVSASLPTAVIGYRIGYTDSWVYINVKDNGMRIEISAGRYITLSERPFHVK